MKSSLLLLTSLAVFLVVAGCESQEPTVGNPPPGAPLVTVPPPTNTPTHNLTKLQAVPAAVKETYMGRFANAPITSVETQTTAAGQWLYVVHFILNGTPQMITYDGAGNTIDTTAPSAVLPPTPPAGMPATQPAPTTTPAQ